MEAEQPQPVTRLLRQWAAGNRDCLDQLVPMVDAELRRIARRHLRLERSGHTLRITALINEAYLRFVNGTEVRAEHRAQFFCLAAQIMRHILVDHARSAHRGKRGGGIRGLALVAFASDRSGSDDLDIYVKQIDGAGSAVRLTADPADDYDPTFSPDGTRVAFRSERNGGGIYDVSTLGGATRLLVSQGRHPRFSPDGRFLLYWMAPVAGRGSPSGKYASLFVQRISGGRPLRIGTDSTTIDSMAV